MRLRCTNWVHPSGTRAKRKAAEQVRDTAAELLNLYARRAAREGFAHRFSPQDYEAFATSALALKKPLTNAPPFTRSFRTWSRRKPHGPPGLRRCGLWQNRSGLARRLSWPCTAASKWPSWPPPLCWPSSTSTRLNDRFGKWPVKIVPSCRGFAAPRRSRLAIEGIADGTRRHRGGHAQAAVVGDVKFPRLGLLVIDEEHRFGVRHKEAMKAFRAEVDVLTLTATPIPRTLGMALEGPARPERDCHRPATPPGDQDFCSQRRQQRDSRSRAA